MINKDKEQIAIDRKLPQQYEHLIDQMQYTTLLNICLEVLGKQGTVQSVTDGTIKMGRPTNLSSRFSGYAIVFGH